MIETAITAIVAFGSTNVDDIFLLMILFSQSPAVFTRKNIMLGQYAGIIMLITLSVAGASLGFFVSVKYIGLLGFLPIYLGLKKIRAGEENASADDDIIKNEETANRKLVGWVDPKILTVASITIANGSDNIGVYVPLFAIFGRQEMLFIVIVFLSLVFVWLRVAEALAKHPFTGRIVKKYSARLFPFLLVALVLIFLLNVRPIS